MNTQTETVGFIGLGTMGSPMATNIAAAGYELYLHDADPQRPAELAEEIKTQTGKQTHPAAESQALSACTLLVLMLPTSRIVRSVLLTETGELAIPLNPGTVVVDMSSSDPTETVETGWSLAQHGIHLVDAPVSGARERAVNGTLAIMMGADDDDAATRATPVIEAMSRAIYRTGKLGTGHAMKALNNFVAGAAVAATSEALTAGERFGLDPAVMVDVLNDSTGQSFITSHVLGPHVVQGRYASGFALPLITKDIGIARSLQEAVGHRAPVCDAVAEQFNTALQSLGNVDHTEAYRHWKQD
ncbi:NAD(P)-dependent oxidoreductase [Nesterenkonia sp. MY13]|uniref:NAD(P)-dependent oxidoreductase n=1 Tax=Nesterenkonia sedimenti TaxID=1463632 RepID=A0A7X8TKZ2_9MICC|nr:NAD(P)-dependent oxidoreductase [Nesterenkonia sedimenti]NLS10701.1 NAD(P)-dependent oxidoreductase [Nesterenkonia sedimenti]